MSWQNVGERAGSAATGPRYSLLPVARFASKRQNDKPTVAEEGVRPVDQRIARRREFISGDAAPVMSLYVAMNGLARTLAVER